MKWHYDCKANRLRIMKLSKFVIFFIITKSAFSVHADPTTNQVFRDHANFIPQSIIDKCGIKQIGRLNLPELTDNTEKLNWHVVGAHSLVLDVAGKNRSWAVHDRATKTVLVNELSLQAALKSSRLKESVTIMALHEALRDYGVDDENYQLTLSLDILQDTCSPRLVQKFFARASGGVTTTGGGGNDAAIYVKRVLLMSSSNEKAWQRFTSRFPELKKWTHEQFVELVLDLSIENHEHPTLSSSVVEKNGKFIYKIPHFIFGIEDSAPVMQFWPPFINLIIQHEK